MRTGAPRHRLRSRLGLGPVGEQRQPLSRDDAVRLCERVSALSRAGLATDRTWQVLSLGPGPQAQVAATVAGMLTIGGTTAEGLRLAAGSCSGPGAEALNWLATTAEVVYRSGAGAAGVLDSIGDGLLAQIAESDEREVTLAGPRTTGRVLATLPVIGLALGAALGINTVGVLFGTGPGLVCLLGGTGFWWLGHLWTTHLVRAAHREAP